MLYIKTCGSGKWGVRNRFCRFLGGSVALGLAGSIGSLLIAQGTAA